MSEMLRRGPSFAILTHAKGGFFLLTFLSVRTDFHNSFEYYKNSSRLSKRTNGTLTSVIKLHSNCSTPLVPAFPLNPPLRVPIRARFAIPFVLTTIHFASPATPFF